MAVLLCQVDQVDFCYPDFDGFQESVGTDYHVDRKREDWRPRELGTTTLWFLCFE